MKRIKIKPISFLFFACAIPFVILILSKAGFEESVKKIDWYSPFYIFTLQFGVGGLLFIKLFKDFAIWTKNIWQGNVKNDSKLVLITLSILLTGILIICLLWIEGRSRVQMDEGVYLITAQNLYHNQVGTICLEGSFENGKLECQRGNTIKPRGLSYLYMLGIPIFGADLYWVYNFQVFILALTIPIFFLALLAWLKNKWLALLSVTLLGMQPVLLFYSRSSSIEGLYVLIFALSLLFLKWAYDRNTTRHWLLLALTLAFLAQTRSEAVFCFSAFIAVAFYKIVIASETWRTSRIFSILNSQFSFFLTTLSVFSLPVFCTLSVNMNHDLQGGVYGARGHLFGNIIADFKLMAFSYYDPDGLLSQPYLPYFTWLALLGLITLITLTIKEFRSQSSIPHTPYPIPYKYILAFLLLLSPQYIILFDSVSADLALGTQARFVLIILPAMSFLGALLVNQITALLKNKINPKILLIGIITIVLTNTLVQFENFKQNILFRGNLLAKEDYLLGKFFSEKHLPNDKKIFFSFTPIIFLAHGSSALSFKAIFLANNEHIQDLIKQYDGNVYASENYCYSMGGPPKMVSPSAFRICDRAISYFDTDTVLNIKMSNNDIDAFLILHKILRLNERDPKGLLRITNKMETPDSNVNLYYTIPKDTIVPWQIEHFLNDSLIFTSKYQYGHNNDLFKLSQFDRDTNIWRLDIVDSVTNEKIHSDFWQLVKVK